MSADLVDRDVRIENDCIIRHQPSWLFDLVRDAKMVMFMQENDR